MNGGPTRQNVLKSIVVYSTILLLAAVTFNTDMRHLLIHPKTLQASFDELATDMLGQIDGADTPIYTKAATDNTPNARGFSNNLGGVAIDSVHHRLFVTDRSNYRVLVYNLNSSNQLVDRVADFVIGQTDFRSNVVSVDQVHLRDPAGLAYDPNHDLLFVADGPLGWACRIMVFDVSTITNGMDAVHVIGRASFFDSSCNDFVQLEQNQTRTPFYLAYDSVHDRLFDSELSGPRVLMWDLSQGITDGMDATHVLGQFDFHTQDVAMLNSPVGQRFYFPAGIAYDGVSDRLFVADQAEYRITIFNVASASFTDGETADHVLGAPDLTTRGTCPDPPTQSNTCFGQALAYDETNGRLFVVDNGNYRTLVFNVASGSFTDGDPAAFELGQEAFNFSTFDAAPAATSSNDPVGVAYDPDSQSLFVSESGNRRVLVYDVNSITNGEPAVDGLGQLDGSDAIQFTTNRQNNAPNAQGLSDPSYSIVDHVHHRLFVSDSGNNRILVFDLNTDDQLLDHTADFVLGQPDFSSNTGAASQTSLDYPAGLAYDAANDRLFVADLHNNRVMVFDVAAITNGEAAINVIGQTDFVSNGTSLDQQHISAAIALAYDSTTKRLFVADAGYNRVMVFDADPTVLIPDTPATDGPLAVNELGQDNGDESPSYYDQGTSSTSRHNLSAPGGISVDEAGQRLFVMDAGNVRVMVFDISTSVLVPDANPLNTANGPEAIHEIGQLNDADPYNSIDDCNTRYSAPAADCFSSALNGVTFDAANDRLLVPDTDNHRVLSFDAAAGSMTDGEAATEVWGQPDFTTGSPNTTQSGFTSPTDVAVGSGLYVVDAANNRVMYFGAPPPTPTPSETPASGGHSQQQPPASIGFFPDRIVINDDQSSTDSKNVLVSVYAHYGPDFTGTVDVLLSNTPDFAATIPFRYTISAKGTNTAWPKTIAWDLCFGLPSTTPCNPGNKTVYARFYVNLPDVWPALTPLAPLENIIR